METWKPLAGFDGLYECSDQGGVRSARDCCSSKKGKLLKPSTGRTGYQMLCLRKDGKYHGKYVHRLVMETFVGGSDLSVNHINGIKADNRLCNLEYISIRDNLLHATRVLGKRRGSSHWAAKLDDEKIRQIRVSLARGETHESVGRAFGVSRVVISNINSGRTWSHVQS